MKEGCKSAQERIIYNLMFDTGTERTIPTQKLHTENCTIRLEIIGHGEPVVAFVIKKEEDKKKRTGLQP